MSRQSFRHQLNREDPRRPSVICTSTAADLWVARGYDENGTFHCEASIGIQEAQQAAIEWATNGYPKNPEAQS